MPHSDDGTDHGVKRELEQALLENQELHARLRRFDEPATLVRALLGIARRDLRRGLSRLRRRQAPAMEQAEPADPNFASTFRPYRLTLPPATAHTRPRVLHAIANLYTGGSARLVVDLVEGLSDRFEHVTVVRDVPPRPHYVGLELHEVPSLSRPRDALSLIQRHRPDLVHVHFLGHHRHPYSEIDWRWYDCLFQAASEYGAPIVENINIPVSPYFSDAVTRYVFVSDYVRGIFGQSDGPNATIYPGSDFTLFSRAPGTAPPPACLGMVYRLEKDKLDETAIDVFIEVLRKRPEARALIVGGGRFLEPYRAAVERAGLAHAFTFTAYVSYADLQPLYEQVSIFVAPVHWESFGHVVPLAMNMGIPVAAYGVGALPEILGDQSVLAPAGDVGALADRIVELLDDRERRDRIGQANRDRAQRLFSVEAMVDAYGTLYDEILRPVGVSDELAPSARP